MKLKFVANFRNRPSKVLWNALYRNFISNLVLYTTPKLICFEFLSCLNKGLNDGWWLRVTHSWHIREVSAAKLISQVNKITFRHFAQKLWIFINCHILSYIWVQQKEWAALKSRIYFTPQFQELFTITSTCFQTLWLSRLTWVKPNAKIFIERRVFPFKFSLLEWRPASESIQSA